MLTLTIVNIFTEVYKIIYENSDVFLQQLWNSLYRADLKQILLLGKDVFDNFHKEFIDFFEKNRIEDGIEINWKVMYGVCRK